MLRDFGLVTVVDLARLAARRARRPAGGARRSPSGAPAVAARRAPQPASAPAPSRREAAAACWSSRVRGRAARRGSRFNSIATETPGLAAGCRRATTLPPFAMPLSTSSCRGRCDANVATRAGQGAAGERPACEVRGAHVLNSCELAERGPFVLAFVFDPVAALPRAGRRVGGRRGGQPRRRSSRIVAVRARCGCRRVGCRSILPVGYDHDGAVANEYAVVVCPTITFVARAGEVAGSTVGPLERGGDRRLGAARLSGEPAGSTGPRSGVDPPFAAELPGLRSRGARSR